MSIQKSSNHSRPSQGRSTSAKKAVTRTSTTAVESGASETGKPRTAGSRALALSKTSGKTSLAPALVDTAANDKLMGEQLTEQYQKAVSGQTEVVKFGAMMIRLQETLFAREQGTGNGRKGDGVKGWLAKHAPKVNRTTAYRFMHVAEAVQRAFELPANVSFLQLACSTADELPEKLRKRQVALFEFINGTSQRSWLDMFKPKSEVGGARIKTKDLTPEEQEAALNEKAQGIFKSFFVSVTQAQEDYRELLLRLPAASKNPEAEVGLVQLRDQLKPLLTLIEDALSTRQKLAR